MGTSHGDQHGHHGTWKRLGTGALLTQDADEGLGHIVPIAVFNKIIVALIVLTVITVGVAYLHVSPTMHVLLAIIVASVKAALVATFFMHLKFEGKTILMYVIYPLIILFLLIGGTIGDNLTRGTVRPMHGDFGNFQRVDRPIEPAGEGHGHGGGSAHAVPNEHGAGGALGETHGGIESDPKHY